MQYNSFLSGVIRRRGEKFLSGIEGVEVATRSKRPTRFKGIVAAIAGGGLLIIAAVMAVEILRAVWFRSVQGTVVSTKLESVVSGRINLHKPVIEYSYVVGGTPYQNNTFTLVDDDGTDQWARSVLEDYTVGATCTVYYNPFNPQTSALSTRPTSRALWLMIGFTFLGVVHLVGGILAVRATT
jgi:hypothetical protein